MAETSTGTNTETTEKVHSKVRFTEEKVGNGLYHKRHTERLGCAE